MNIARFMPIICILILGFMQHVEGAGLNNTQPRQDGDDGPGPVEITGDALVGAGSIVASIFNGLTQFPVSTIYNSLLMNPIQPAGTKTTNATVVTTPKPKPQQQQVQAEQPKPMQPAPVPVQVPVSFPAYIPVPVTSTPVPQTTTEEPEDGDSDEDEDAKSRQSVLTLLSK